MRIHGNRIVEVGKQSNIDQNTADVVIDASGMVVIPGFINAHTHGLASLLRARGANLPPDQEWHQVVKWPFLEKLSPSDAAVATKLTAIECIKSGVTTVVDQYYPHKAHQESHVDSILSSYQALGLRAGFVRAFHEDNPISPSIMHEPRSKIVSETESLLKKWNAKDDHKIHIFAGPDNLLFTSIETSKQISNLLKKYNSSMQSHVAESHEVEKMVVNRHGKGTIQTLADNDLLEKGFQAVHATYLTPNEVKLFQDCQTSVIHCPLTNAIYGEGVAPVAYLLAAGIPVGLGTDASGTYNGNNILTALHMAAYLHRLVTKQPSLTGELTDTDPLYTTETMKPIDVLSMGTIEGAKALGMETFIGSLEDGKLADLTILDPRHLTYIPTADPITLLVYYLEQECVNTVMVDGETMMENGKLICVDEEKFFALVEKTGNQLFS